MDIVQAIILALIQGLTEFLPISSSGHLILPSEVLGWPDQGLAFDVAVHAGTLLAVLLYFRQDVADIVCGSVKSLSGNVTPSGRLGLCITIATIPAGLAGLFFNDLIETHARTSAVIASTTIIFGLLLAWADTKRGASDIYAFSMKAALIVGCAQALALIPGTSRSGITITAALVLGFSRDASARFSFLMSIPIILLSAMYKGLELFSQAQVDWFLITVGVAVSAVSAYLCIYFFLSFINRLGMMPFVYYRLLLGAILIIMIV